MISAADVFDDGDYYTGPPLAGSLVHETEQTLGVRLPSSYVDLLMQRNGGSLRRRCCGTPFPSSWAPDHIEIRAILGIGGRLGIESSRSLIAEWGYPDIGVVVCDLPSGGHDTVMLDYSACGREGEPMVSYVDEDRVPRHIASSFTGFVGRLEPCERFHPAP